MRWVGGIGGICNYLMEPTAYKLTYRVQERPGKLILGIILFLIPSSVGGKVTIWFSELISPYSSIAGRLILLIGLLGFFGLTWAFIKLTRTLSTVVLEEDGFTIIRHSKLNVLPDRETIYSWADFSYQSGGYNSPKYKTYALSVFFKDGNSCDFLTGISPMEIDVINKLHEDIVQRVSAYNARLQS